MPNRSSRRATRTAKPSEFETAIRKHEIFFERCENFSVLARYLFHLFDYG